MFIFWEQKLGFLWDFSLFIWSSEIDPSRARESQPPLTTLTVSEMDVDLIQFNQNKWKPISELFLSPLWETCALLPLDGKPVKRQLGATGSFLHPPMKQTLVTRTEPTAGRMNLRSLLKYLNFHVWDYIFSYITQKKLLFVVKWIWEIPCWITHKVHGM